MNLYSPLNNSSIFESIYRKGQKWHTTGFVIFYSLSTSLPPSVAFVASKKVGGAVERNKAKRRLRSLFRHFQNSIVPGVYIIVAKPECITLEYSLLKNDFFRALIRTKLIVEKG